MQTAVFSSAATVRTCHSEDRLRNFRLHTNQHTDEFHQNDCSVSKKAAFNNINLVRYFRPRLGICKSEKEI